MTPDSLFFQSIVVILACAAAVVLFARLRFPTVVAYLAVGVILGPHGLNVVRTSTEARFLAELGIVFLLFTIGLEFSFSNLLAARRAVLGAGGLQTGITIAVTTAGATLMGFDGRSSVLLGAVVAMSSTAVVLKQLSERGELVTDHGRLAAGILLFQDLAALPFLVLVDIWAGNEPVSAVYIAKQLATAALAFTAVAVFSRPLFMGALSRAARLRSSEVTLLTSFSLALGTAFLTHSAGMSAPVGAFLAGMIIGETDFRHQIEDDFRPFRDLLVGVFFVTTGMDIDLTIILRSPAAVLAFIALFAGKSAIVYGAVRLLGVRPDIAVRTAACLAQGGEFGLLLLALGLSGGVIEANIAQPALVAVVLSMAAAPAIIDRNRWFVGFFTRLPHSKGSRGEAAAVHAESEQLDHHVVLLGCGRIGRVIAEVLADARIRYIALEHDIEKFRRARDFGCHVVLADARRARVLAAAGLARADLLIITFHDRRALRRVLHEAKRENETLTALVSSHDELELSAVTDAGASVVYPENVAAGIELGSKALSLLGLPGDQSESIAARVRSRFDLIRTT
jgi:CPA2 family monovalent cation:H+ antiporter-2